MPYNFRRISIGVFASNQVRPKATYLLGLRATGLPTKRPLSFLVNALTFIKDKADVRTKEKS